MNTKNKRIATEKMVLGAMMTALVVILQCLATYTTFFGPFSTAVALVPIVIGAALCGTGVGAWLGLVFGGVVILTGNAALFLAFSVPGTIITVLCKGMACGAAAGVVHKLLKKFNDIVAAVASAVICPVVNTGVFLLGCRVFFMPYADAIAETLGLTVSGMDLFFALAGANFLLELGMNLVLSPVIVKLISLAKKK
ncbi:MAG: ECF transporter S component [Clostridia bacterium]|nr:ECF transporter S component [Clostridia bacterium]